MNPQVKEALVHRLIALADDELLLAHRDSEWTGHAPIIEEDIALANLAQDELGHATLWYGLAEDLGAGNPDKLVYFRGAPEWRNAQILELPKGDWAFTMLRQYLFDAYEHLHLAELTRSSYQPLAEAAQKVRKEEQFHLQHSRTWARRLGLGSEESQQRMQTALDQLWPYAQQLFMPLPDEAVLVAEGIVPEVRGLKDEWLERVREHLEASGLTIPESSSPPATSRTEHSEHLAQLLGELQEVAHYEPEGVW
jgi:ring-1,2-phenylacetyl-CoA epoxidase subunit PaaC